MRDRLSLLLLLGVLLTASHSAQACATCMGAPDSKLTIGLNWGIASLLAVVGFVLGCTTAFFVYLARRASAFPMDEHPGEDGNRGPNGNQ